MSGIDIILLVLILLALIRGFIKGFIMQLAGLAALLLGIYVSIHFSAYLGERLAARVNWNPVAVRWLSFALLFTLVVLAVHFTGIGVEKLAKITQLSFLNRLAGAVFSGVKAIFILAVLITFVQSVNNRFQFFPEEKLAQSKLYTPLSNIIPGLFPRFFSRQQAPVKSEEMMVQKGNASIIKGKCYLCQNFSYDLG